MAQDHVRKELYSKNGVFQIRDAGTQEWHVPPHYFLEPAVKTNVVRPTFNPGTISITQQALQPSFDANAFLNSDLYMYKITFSVTDLYNIRVKERSFGSQEHPQSKIEITAVCKSAPLGHPLVVKAGTNIESVFKVAADTSDPPASSVAIASLSDRWVSGDQEIWLSFTRSTALFRKAGAKKDQSKPEPITGPKVWVWSTFLAFLCGLEWEAPTLDTFQNAAKMSLSQIVDSNNPYADFEKKDDDWVLIKTKSNPEALSAVVPSQTGSSTAVARSSTSRTTFPTCPPPTAGSSTAVAGSLASRITFPTRPPPTAVSSAVLDSPWASNEPLPGANLSESVKAGKGKATEEVGDDGQGKRVGIGNRSQLERELHEASLVQS